MKLVRKGLSLVCCLSISVQLVVYVCSCISVVLFPTLGTPDVTARCFYRVLIPDSSLALCLIYLFPMLIDRWVRKHSRGPYYSNHCRSKGQGFRSSKTCLSPSPSNLLPTVPRWFFYCDSSLLNVVISVCIWSSAIWSPLINSCPLCFTFCSVL